VCYNVSSMTFDVSYLVVHWKISLCLLEVETSTFLLFVRRLNYERALGSPTELSRHSENMRYRTP
jgi:hypothetical protein